MLSFPYVFATKKISQFFSHIQTSGKPTKVNIKYLNELGFTKKSDPRIIPMLKFLGFIDSAGVPTDLWSDYRDKSKAKTIIGNAVKKAYADLFSKYQNANDESDDHLGNYFRANTSVGHDALRSMVNTFKTLCKMDDFKAPAERPAKKEVSEKTESPLIGRQITTKGLTLNINIQLQLPATEDASIYEKIFAALKKYLISD